jgi:hypothetical protein
MAFAGFALGLRSLRALSIFQRLVHGPAQSSHSMCRFLDSQRHFTLIGRSSQ